MWLSKFRKYIQISVLILFMIACTKEKDESASNVQSCESECLILSGNIYTGDGTEALKGIKLDASWIYTTMFSGENHLKATSTTDENGYYQLNIKLNEDELSKGVVKIEVFATNDIYFNCFDDPYPIIEFFDFKNDTTITTDYYVPRKGNLVVKAVGASSMANDDHFVITAISKSGINDGIACLKPLGGWTNTTPDKEVNGIIAAEQDLIIEVNIRKNGITNKTYDTLRVDYNQSFIHTVEFK